MMGSWAWRVQPVYLLVELLVAAGASAPYSLRDDTISALGMSACAGGHSGSVVEVCSPWHVGMNVAFVVFGLLRAVGAVLLGPVLGGRPWARAAVLTWVVSGAASAAVGLVPVDRSPGWHAVVATMVFLLQPVAVLLTAEALRRGHRAPRAVVGLGVVVGVLTLVAAAAFAVRLGSPTWVGGLERVALWPAYPWFAVVGVVVVADAAGVGRVAPGPSSSETVTSS